MLDTRYAAVNDLEGKASWIKCYKLVCLIFSIIGFALIVWNVIILIEKIITIFSPSIFYYAANTAVYIFETVIFYFQYRAIHYVNYELQQRTVALSKLNLVVWPAWSWLGGILLADLTVIFGIVSGFIAFLIALFFFYMSIQVRNVFEGKSMFGGKGGNIGYTNP